MSRCRDDLEGGSPGDGVLLDFTNKQQVLTQLLAHHAMVRCVVYGPGVASWGIPESKWNEQGFVALDVGYSMPRPIGGLTIDGNGIAGVFSFDGAERHVSVPLDALVSVGVEGVRIAWPVPQKWPEHQKPKLGLVK